MGAPTTTIDLLRGLAGLMRRSGCRACMRAKAREARGAAWSEVVVLLALASIVGVGAVIVGPRLLSGALTRTSSDSSAPLRGEAARQQEILEELLAGRRRLLAIHYQQAGEAQLDLMVLWVADDRYPGLVNLSELLVLRYSPLLRCVLAFTWTPPHDDDPVLSEAEVRSARRIEELTMRADVMRTVIAQPVVSCEITGINSTQPLRPDAMPSAALVRLTWLDESTDTRQVSTLATDLRWVAAQDRF